MVTLLGRFTRSGLSPPSVPACHPRPVAILAETNCSQLNLDVHSWPFQVKQSGQKGQLSMRTVTPRGVLSHNLVLLLLGLSYS